MGKKKFGVSFNEMQGTLQNNMRAFVLYTILAFVLMGITAIAIFFAANRGEEQVLVPDVTGKTLARALLEMQDRELYPKLQLRYSDMPGEAGQVLSQSPKAGSIAKAGRRITLVVSRGIVIDHVGNFVGTNLDMLKAKLDALYGGVDTPLLTIGTPVFKIDQSPVGTILEQDPPEGTVINQPVELKFIISAGPEKPIVRLPDFTGNTIAQVLNEMGKVNLLFDFKSHIAEDSEKPGTVVSQSIQANSAVDEFSHVTLDIAMPALDAVFSGDTVVDIRGRTEDEVAGMNVGGMKNSSHGIFTTKISRYPIAVPVKLDALPPEGAPYTLVSFNHIGGEITVPYSVPHGTTLVLTVINQEKERQTVQ